MAYIQNHVNWCWAAAAKITGVQYCCKNHIQPYLSGLEGINVIREDPTGLRPPACGISGGRLTVDVAQLEIVEHAKDPNHNPDGNAPEGDDGKARALRYIITGNPWDASLEIAVCGYYADSQDLLSTSANQIQEAIELGNPFIGNYQRENGLFHSVVLCPKKGSQIELYDPWDGYKEQFTLSQVFQSGFLTNSGRGVIRWIQYIR